MRKSTCLLFVLSFMFFCENLFSQIPTDSLVAYYPFNGNAKDMSGNGRDGVVFGAVPTTDRFNKSNAAYYFNGYTNYITTSTSNCLKTNFSLVAWIKTPNSYGYAGVLCSRDSFNKMTGISMWKDSLALLDLSDGTATVRETTSKNKILNDNKWHLLVSVYDGSSHSIFIDGNLNNSSIFNVNPSISAPFMIGWDNLPNYSRYFWGSIDDVRIYKKALSQSEINALYNESITTDINASEVVCPQISLMGKNVCISLRNTGTYMYRIYSVTSQLIRSGISSESNMSVDLSSCKQGVYIVELTDVAGRRLAVKKIVLD